MEQVESRLRDTVYYLSEEIGERSYLDVGKLGLAAEFIEKNLYSFGCVTQRQAFSYRRNTYYNVWTEVKGTGAPAEGILVVGAHYDSAVGTPGADDNASGVAGMLEAMATQQEQGLPFTAEQMAGELRLPMVFVSHAVEEVTRLADHVVVLSEGRAGRDRFLANAGVRSGSGEVRDRLRG